MIEYIIFCVTEIVKLTVGSIVLYFPVIQQITKIINVFDKLWFLS